MILLVLVLPLGCSGGRKTEEHPEEPGSRGFLLCPPPQTIYGEPAHIRFNSRGSHDSLSVNKRLADRVRRNMLHWADYSMMESDNSTQ